MKNLIDAFGQRALRAMGQHFLRDDATLREMVAQAGVGADDVVLEIGPGPGVLTAAVLNAGPQVVAVEKDRRAVEFLRGEFSARLGESASRLHVIEGDALHADLTAPLRALGAPPWVAVGNLPYNVGTGILLRLLELTPHFRRFVLMFQHEVAERLVAGPGSKKFSSLSLAVHNRTEARIVRTLGPESFVPPPKVDSSVVRFDVRAEPLVAADLEAAFETVARAAFSQRRKTLRNSLKGGLPGLDAARLDALIDAAALDPGTRAEALAFEDFVRLARAWRGLDGGLC